MFIGIGLENGEDLSNVYDYNDLGGSEHLKLATSISLSSWLFL